MLIYLLSEDTSKQSPGSLQNLIRKTLAYLEPKINLSQVDIKYPDTHKFITVQNKWRDKNPSGKFNELCLFLASIYLSDDEFCFWHMDGDTIWKEDFKFETSCYYDKFTSLVIKRVENIINGKVEAHFSKELFFKKIIILLPCYSIEAWLYQNYQALPENEASEIKKLKEGSELDLIPQIKDKTTFTNQRNEKLSEIYSSKKIYEIRMSYFSFCESLSINETFISKIPLRT